MVRVQVSVWGMYANAAPEIRRAIESELEGSGITQRLEAILQEYGSVDCGVTLIITPNAAICPLNYSQLSPTPPPTPPMSGSYDHSW